MKKLHWSKNYADFINIEATFIDGGRQTWGYDCQQYESLAALKENMSSDFSDRRIGFVDLTVFVLVNDQNVTAELEPTELGGDKFVSYVFNSVEVLSHGN